MLYLRLEIWILYLIKIFDITEKKIKNIYMPIQMFLIYYLQPYFERFCHTALIPFALVNFYLERWTPPLKFFEV